MAYDQRLADVERAYVNASDEIEKLNAEIERLRAALEAVVKWADDLSYFSEAGSELAPVFQEARAALNGPTTMSDKKDTAAIRKLKDDAA